MNQEEYFNHIQQQWKGALDQELADEWERLEAENVRGDA